MIKTGSNILTAAAHGDHGRRFIDATYFNLFWIFVIASFIGLVGETIVSAFMDGYVKSRAGLVWGPLSPLYGLGAVLMTLAVNNMKDKNPVLIFLATALVGGLLEYVAGWFWETFFGIVAWSYVDQPLNFGGYTCVSTMVVWGIAGTAWAYFGIPLMQRLIGLIPQRMRVPLTAALSVFIAADIAMTVLSFNFWCERLSGAPIDTPIEQFFCTWFGNDWMQQRFGALSMWANLAVNR
ncbi:MAG: putative ABC transporter permease [Eggerthellaceae bacterium]|nr:putative ABC transporter permease [Eggerthellaceae bacterium]